jgi:hypothetical protein
VLEGDILDWSESQLTATAVGLGTTLR